MDIHVTMDIQRLEHTISILIKLDHLQIKVAASSSDMYASIDEAVNRLQQKIRRWKERIQDHAAKSRSFVDMTVNVLRKPYNYIEEINAEIELQKKKDEMHEIIANDKIPLKMLTTQEAVMKMELSDDDFLLFKGEEDQKLKLIYRRPDGNYGLILPQ
jgi:putative sigma-54 modulation protein